MVMKEPCKHSLVRPNFAIEWYAYASNPLQKEKLISHHQWEVVKFFPRTSSKFFLQLGQLYLNSRSPPQREHSYVQVEWVMNSVHQTFHLFKRSSAEFCFHYRIALESSPNVSFVLSHFLFSILWNRVRTGGIDKTERLFEPWQKATWLCRFTKQSWPRENGPWATVWNSKPLWVLIKCSLAVRGES